MPTSRPTWIVLVPVLSTLAFGQEFIEVPAYDPVADPPREPEVVVDPPDLKPVPMNEQPGDSGDNLESVGSSERAEPDERAEPARPADPLDRLVDQAIEDTRRRMLVVVDRPGHQPNENTPWQIAHGVLALRDQYEIVVDRKRVNALEWIATGPTHNDKPWFLKTRWGGKGHPFTAKWQFEGHPNQFLAFFATAGVPLDYEVVGETEDGERESFTLKQWINNAKMEVNAREEITWTLWAFSTYLPPDARWVDQYNRGWSIEKLVRMQMDKHPTKSACGGMHGLFAIANALNAHRATGEPVRGVWLEADHHLKSFIVAIKSMQNRDGSFSANYLKGPEWEQRDIDRRISTTGHTLEFLVNALPDSELSAQWVRRAVHRTALDLSRNKTRPLEPGGMYHACDALVIYRERTRPGYRRTIPRTAARPE